MLLAISMAVAGVRETCRAEARADLVVRLRLEQRQGDVVTVLPLGAAVPGGTEVRVQVEASRGRYMTFWTLGDLAPAARIWPPSGAASTREDTVWSSDWLVVSGGPTVSLVLATNAALAEQPWTETMRSAAVGTLGEGWTCLVPTLSGKGSSQVDLLKVTK